MKFAFIAQTTYQLFNIIRFVFFNIEESKQNSVVYIGNKVSNGIGNIENLKHCGLFSDVYLYEQIIYEKNKLRSKLKTLIYTINRNTFRKSLEEKDAINDVDIVVIPSVSLGSQIFWQYVKHSKVYLIEDGLGTSTGDILIDGMRGVRRIAVRLLYGEIKPDKIYLNNLKLNTSNTITRFEQIPNLSNPELFSCLSGIFLPPNHNESYKKDDVIYLQQPVSIWNESYVNKEKSIIKNINQIFASKMVVRCHPLTIGNDKIDGVRYDSDNYSWEVVCAEQITDNNVLIGYFSTAQFSPKQIFDKEPIVFFLYKILQPVGIELSEVEKMIDKLKNSYKEKDRILVPENEAQFYSMLNNVKARDNEYPSSVKNY